MRQINFKTKADVIEFYATFNHKLSPDRIKKIDKIDLEGLATILTQHLHPTSPNSLWIDQDYLNPLTRIVISAKSIYNPTGGFVGSGEDEIEYSKRWFKFAFVGEISDKEYELFRCTNLKLDAEVSREDYIKNRDRYRFLTYRENKQVSLVNQIDEKTWHFFLNTPTKSGDQLDRISKKIREVFRIENSHFDNINIKFAVKLMKQAFKLLLIGEEERLLKVENQLHESFGIKK